jgi:peptide deformylase
MSAARPSTSIITVENTDKLKHVVSACEEVQPGDLKNNRVADIVNRLKSALISKIPDIGTSTHKVPAYLAANQIADNLRVALLYLPGSDTQTTPLHVILNPTYQVLETYSSEGKLKFRISTFFIEQLRFRNDVALIAITYRDIHWKPQTMNLADTAAVAALFGVGFLYGITPLDYNISKAELLDFINNPEKAIDESTKVTTTRQAYEWDNKAITSHPQFGKDQIKHLANFLAVRDQFPIQYDPTTGKLIATPVLEKQASLGLRKSP